MASVRQAEHGLEKLAALCDAVAGMTVAERIALGDRMVEEGASGVIFEWMHRGGWRPRSQQQGDGIVGGELAEVAPRLRRRKK